MNKQFGYLELKLESGVLPLKAGIYAIEGLCKDFDIELYDLASIMEVRSIPVDGKQVQVEIPKNPTKFFRSILLHSANYIKWYNGEELYTEKHAYEWAGEIGFSSPEAMQVITLFMMSTRSGASPKTVTTEPEKKGKKKALNVSGTS